MLRSHPDEDLSKLIAQAEQAYRTSSPRNLAETQRRYLLLLNLASKVQDAPEPARNDRERRLQEQYLEIEPTLDPSERAAFKEDFFRDAVESQHPEEEKP